MLTEIQTSLGNAFFLSQTIDTSELNVSVIHAYDTNKLNASLWKSCTFLLSFYFDSLSTKNLKPSSDLNNEENLPIYLRNLCECTWLLNGFFI